MLCTTYIYNYTFNDKSVFPSKKINDIIWRTQILDDLMGV